MSVVISDNFIVAAVPDLPPFPLSHAIIGYRNIITETNVTASSEQAGFPGSAVANGLTYDQWRPATNTATLTVDYGETVDADYLGIAAHNLASIGAVVKFEWSVDSISWTELKEFSVGKNAPAMMVFTTTTARYWRLTVTGSDTPQIGVVNIGEALGMQRKMYGGHSPISLSRRTSYSTNISDGGNWLGRSIVRKGNGTSFQWEHLTSEWYRKYFDPFVKAARTTPFFIAWRYDKFPAEIGYCWTEDDIVPTNMGIKDFLSVSMTVKGHTDD